MAAAPASRLNERTVPDYFEVFGLPRRFGIDRMALERRFYELSRETHPDRHAASGAEGMRQAMERMSLLNEAYKTLKSPEELRAYFLKLEGHESAADRGAGAAAAGGAASGGSAAKQQIPAELAESWFELQDAVMEDPSEARAKVAEFEHELKDLREESLAALTEVEHEIDATTAETGSAPRELLDRLSQGIRSLSYLKSMERDVERLKGRL